VFEGSRFGHEDLLLSAQLEFECLPFLSQESRRKPPM
jgi:hypothetical protein